LKFWRKNQDILLKTGVFKHEIFNKLFARNFLTQNFSGKLDFFEKFFVLQKFSVKKFSFNKISC